MGAKLAHAVTLVGPPQSVTNLHLTKDLTT